MPNQFADSDDLAPPPIKTARNQYMDEIPTSDPTNHENATPQHSGPMYTGRHYNDDTNYAGNGTTPPTASKESMSVNADEVKRGDES